MRRAPFALASALLVASGCTLPFNLRLPFGPAPEPPSPARPETEPAAVEPARVDAPGRHAQPFDAIWYDVELALPDTTDWLIGRTRVRVQPVEGAVAVDTLVLDFTGLHVDQVTVAGVPVQATLVGDRLAVPLDSVVASTPEASFDVEVHYRGVPDDGLFIAPDVHGGPSAFADNWPNRARFWFPSIDHPSDKAQVTFTIHAPAAWSVVANGFLDGDPIPTPASVPVPDPAPRRTWRWATRTRIPTYTMVVGAGRLESRVDTLAACGRAPASPREDGCAEVSWWAFQPDTAHAARMFARAPDMIEFFTEYVGAFPYEKLANVQSATRFGGMENASAIFYSGQALAGRADIEGTVSHEIAHQWFGDSVTPDEWSHLWLSEGFASYFGAMFFEAADGAEAFRSRMQAYRRTLIESGDADVEMVGLVGESLYDLLNRNNYEKGAWVLHMLRGLLGDESFHAGIRHYYATHAHGNALTDDLRASLELASARSLETFFQTWVEGRGYPILRTSHGYDALRGEAIVVITQVQSPDWPRFRMPLDLELYWEGGSRRERVEMINAREVYTFRTPGPVTRITIDPDGWLLHAREGEVR